MEERRKILLQTLQQYLEAMVRKTPEKLPVSERLKVTFNGRPAELGKNEIWDNALIIPQRQTFVDVISSNVMFFGIVSNEGAQCLFPTPSASMDFALNYPYVLRIHVDQDKIDEVEETFVEKRNYGFPTPFENIQFPEQIFNMVVPAEERLTREELISIVDKYWIGISKKIPGTDVPTHPDVVRIENGSKCTDRRTTFQREFDVPTWGWDTPAEKRRYPVVDEKRGLVVSVQVFYNKNDPQKKGFCVYEAFRMEDGLIRYLYAFWRHYMTETGWESEY